MLFILSATLKQTCWGWEEKGGGGEGGGKKERQIIISTNATCSRGFSKGKALETRLYRTQSKEEQYVLYHNLMLLSMFSFIMFLQFLVAVHKILGSHKQVITA